MVFDSFKKTDRLPHYDDDPRYKPRQKSKFWFGNLKNRQKKKIQTAVLVILSVLGVWKLLFSPLFGFDKQQNQTIVYYDLAKYEGTSTGAENGEYVLVCIPLRNAEPVIPMMISHLQNLTYPHSQLDLAFLVSDSDDNTEASLNTGLKLLTDFHDIQVFQKDFGAVTGQGFDDRHSVHVQGMRRKLMGRARNWLTSVSLKPYHSWIYWRDADIETSPTSIIEDLMKHNRDVIVPNVWRPLPDWLGSEQPYDLNSWQESDPGMELAKTLNEDDVIVEGYAEYTTWRPHLAYFRDAEGDPDLMYDLDGIGGVSILAKAKVFRHGSHFPGFTFMNHAETEGFGKMCKKMGFQVNGLPNYTIWHLYEPSEDDLKKMKEMAESDHNDDKSKATQLVKAPQASINQRYMETAVAEGDLPVASQQ